MVRSLGWVVLSLSLLLAGCGGGSSADTTGPGIVSYSPSAGATLVDQDSPVTLVFNEAINHATVNSSTFALRRADNSLVAGSYEFTDNAYLYSGTAVRFVPAARLDDNALYQVAVSTAITDLAGNRLVAPLSWSFTTMPAGLGTWAPTATSNAPPASVFHTAVWTGSEMLVWGGIGLGSQGFRYNSVGGGSWTPMATANAPSPRTGHTAVWTGTEMIIWGGVLNGSSYGWLNDGALYNPATNTWRPISGLNAPTARGGHSAVWTGSAMLVWGGAGEGDTTFASGARYDPAGNVWTPMSSSAAPTARWGHRAVWTGSRMLVWGGYPYTRLGGQYDPLGNAWSYTTTLAAPLARTDHTAVWTGSQMLVWGGSNGTPLATGGRYTP